MAHVNILPPELVSKIAAGEVVERPSSVVKELIENALDAEADRIEINIKDAGKSLIQIKDNGCGIAQDDVEKVFLRHATSKLKEIDDLYRVASLGFRGEALYSIAAVADVILRSKTDGQETGWEIHVRGSDQIDFKPVGMRQGTEIEIKELFFNTPVRRKFLKKQTTEFNQILSTVIPYTLVHPQCTFLLTSNFKSARRVVLDLQADKNIVNRIARSLNVDADNLVERQERIPLKDVTLHAVLGDSNIRRTSKDMQFIFVNKRPVYHRLLNYQINDMYRSIFPSEVYPFFILFLTVPPEDIDVNIHPTKREVKIKNEYDLCSIVRELCEDALMSRSKAKQADTAVFKMPKKSYDTEQHSVQNNYSFNRPEGSRQYSPSVSEPSADYIATATQNLLDPAVTSVTQEPSFTLKNKLMQSHFCGSFLKKYLFFESSSSLLIIDQHAAQERITYEHLIHQVKKGQVETQNLLAPIVLKLTAQELLKWENIAEDIKQIGFSTAQWDPESIAIHSHPQLINNPEFALRNLLDEVDVSRCDKETLARRACRQSVMAGDSVGYSEAEHLRERLANCAEPFTCPHGRPTVIELQEKFLSKQFLRT